MSRTPWVGVITDAGSAAMERTVVTGETLTVNLVKIGTGSVPASEMRAATDLQEYVGNGSIDRKQKTDYGINIRIQITPTAAEHTFTEIGVYGTVGNDANSVLISLYQNDDGILVPSSSDFPDYIYKLNQLWDVSNSDAIDVIVDTTALVTQEELDTKISIAQGIGNAGKFMMVGADGNVAPVTVPFAEGSEF